MNWKMLALGLARLMGIGAVVGVTVLVMKHGQSTGQQALVDAPQAPPSAPMSAPAPQRDDSAAQRLRAIKAECREIAQAKVKERTGEILKDTAIGALIGAGTGSAGGAIAGGGSGAGKGAAIGGVVGAVGGAVYGVDKNSKEAIFKRSYDDCMRSRA